MKMRLERLSCDSAARSLDAINLDRAIAGLTACESLVVNWRVSDARSR